MGDYFIVLIDDNLRIDQALMAVRLESSPDYSLRNPLSLLFYFFKYLSESIIVVS